MSQETWSAVDEYLCDVLVPADAALTDPLHDSDAAGLPSIHVAPNQGRMLYLLARLRGARKILEIGTLAGYSTIWLARALPADGRLITLELDPRHAAVARTNITRAGLDAVVELRVGAAAETLRKLVQEDAGPFDLVFMDADKPGNPEYLGWALKMSRPGTLIIGDNVVRDGAVVDAESRDRSVIGTRRFLELIGSNPRLEATAIQTVGTKGHDGFVMAIVLS